MKKVLLITSILFVAVASTACINNLAVQDLNNKAKVYMEKGDYSQAIERLKSSIDLDSSIFETHYNLAIAYTKAEDYLNAVEEYKKAIAIKPNMPDAYYSLATAENNLAIDIEQGKIRVNEDKSLYPVDSQNSQYSDNVDEAVKFMPSELDNEVISDLYAHAIQNYEKYLSLNSNASDKTEVLKQIEVIKSSLNPEMENPEN